MFEENVAAGDGGAVFSAGTGDYYGTPITSCRFDGNVAANGGAAFLNHYDVVQSSVFLDNEASLDGGALFLDAIQPDEDNYANYTGNVFARNTAGDEGGAIYVLGSSTELYLNNNTFVANGAASGGHIWTSANPVVRSCIFAFATEGGAGAGTETVAPRCTDVFGNAGGDFVGAFVNGGSTPSNFSADPLLCDVAGSDFTLRVGSPCLPPLPAGCLSVIGAEPMGCGTISIESESWGSVKARYR